MKITYTNKDGGDVIAGIAAQTVGEELERIRQAHSGELSPGDVVQAAKEPGNPIHNAFPWNDKEAAHAQRLWVARQLIKSVSFVIHKDEERTIVPNYLTVPATKDTRRHYQATKVVVTRDSEWAAALGDLLNRAEGIRGTIDKLTRLARALKRDPRPISVAATHFARGTEAIAKMKETARKKAA